MAKCDTGVTRTAKDNHRPLTFMVFVCFIENTGARKNHENTETHNKTPKSGQSLFA